MPCRSWTAEFPFAERLEQLSERGGLHKRLQHRQALLPARDALPWQQHLHLITGIDLHMQVREALQDDVGGQRGHIFESGPTTKDCSQG